MGTDAEALIEKYGKGKPLPAIVENISSGSNVRVTLLPDFQSFAVILAGVRAPTLARRVPVAADAGVANGNGAAPAAAGPAAGTAAAIVAAGGPDAGVANGKEANVDQPFAAQAKAFTERKALNREVDLG